MKTISKFAGTLAVLLWAGAAAVAQDVMELTDKNGAGIKVKVEACDGVQVEVTRVTDSKAFTIPLSRLDEASVKQLQTWQAKGGGLIKRLDIDVSTGKTTRNKAGDDFDDKRVNLDPVVTLSNPHLSMRSCSCKMTVVFYGRPIVDRSAMHIFKTATFDVPELGPGEAKEFKVGKISSAYDNRGYAKFGARYGGYAVVVHDPAGEFTYSSKSVPSALVEGQELLFLKLKTGKDYDKGFEELDLPRYEY